MTPLAKTVATLAYKTALLLDGELRPQGYNDEHFPLILGLVAARLLCAATANPVETLQFLIDTYPNVIDPTQTKQPDDGD